MSKRYKSIQVFQNPILEKFTHVHPITPLIVWVPIIGLMLYRSLAVDHVSPFVAGALGAAGFFAWTLTEYVLHRYIFHFEADTPFQERLQFLIHGLHHADPIDPTRLVMPPVAAVLIAVPLYWLFRAFLGATYVVPFFAFFLVGYLCYDYIHYSVHHFKPRTRLGRALKQSHMLHHYVTPNARWGVSSPIWDVVFGTLDEPVGSVATAKRKKEQLGSV